MVKAQGKSISNSNVAILRASGDASVRRHESLRERFSRHCVLLSWVGSSLHGNVSPEMNQF